MPDGGSAIAVSEATSGRLAFFVGGVFLAESAFYAVIPPLVPGFVREAHMSTTQVGILVAAYPAGVLVAALPSMALVDRRGVRLTAIAGLGLLVAATIGFAWSTTPLLLDAARFVQGIGGAVAWAGALAWLTSAAPTKKRASVIGGALGTALVGMMLGPAVGALASQVGRGTVFSAMAVVIAAMALAGPAAPIVTAAHRNSFLALAGLLRNRDAAVGNALMAVIGVINGTIASLIPLLVTRRQGSPATIAIIMASSYLIAALLSVFIGTLSDRFGRLIPAIAGFAIGAVLLPVLPAIGSLLLLALAAVVAAAAVSGLWTPTAAMVTDGAVPGPAGHAVAVATLNAAWAAGGAAGAIVVARLADSAGFEPPFILVGALCGAAVLVAGVTYWRGAHGRVLEQRVISH